MLTEASADLTHEISAIFCISVLDSAISQVCILLNNGFDICKRNEYEEMALHLAVAT